MIKVLIDTNVLVSAALFPQSIPAQAYMTAVMRVAHADIIDPIGETLSMLGVLVVVIGV